MFLWNRFAKDSVLHTHPFCVSLNLILNVNLYKVMLVCPLTVPEWCGGLTRNWKCLRGLHTMQNAYLCILSRHFQLHGKINFKMGFLINDFFA